MTKIEQYDDDICRLKGFLHRPTRYHDGRGYELVIDFIAYDLIKDLVQREIERLTAERNNLIRLGN